MDTEFCYTCPSCSKECSVPESMTGQNLVCPHCNQEFYATPPQAVNSSPDGSTTGRPSSSVPDRLPLFKSGKKKLLEARLAELVADGELDKADEHELAHFVIQLGLDASDLTAVKNENLVREFEPLKRRIESTLMLSDDDLENLRELEKKYATTLNLDGMNDVLRGVYLVEVKNQIPAPIQTDLMLKPQEAVYFEVKTGWHQTRVVRVGAYLRDEQLTGLAAGMLYVTSHRLLFNGLPRNTTVELNKIVDCTVFSDGLKVDKATGKPDFFAMSAPQARYAASLIARLRNS